MVMLKDSLTIESIEQTGLTVANFVASPIPERGPTISRLGAILPGIGLQSQQAVSAVEVARE